MAKKKDKTADKVRFLFNKLNTKTRSQWEYINQKGFDFSNDNQLTDAERQAVREGRIIDEQGNTIGTITSRGT